MNTALALANSNLLGNVRCEVFESTYLPVTIWIYLKSLSEYAGDEEYCWTEGIKRYLGNLSHCDIGGVYNMRLTALQWFYFYCYKLLI